MCDANFGIWSDDPDVDVCDAKSCVAGVDPIVDSFNEDGIRDIFCSSLAFESRISSFFFSSSSTAGHFVVDEIVTHCSCKESKSCSKFVG